jgi:hypothetical protein
LRFRRHLASSLCGLLRHRPDLFHGIGSAYMRAVTRFRNPGQLR